MAKKQYEFLKHTADAKFRAYGKTLEEAFVNAAYATTDIITDHKKVKAKVKKQFEIESEDQKALLYDFLERIIVLVDTDSFIISKVEDVKIKQVDGGYELTAKFSGDNVIENYDIKTTIKASTYQEMEIEKIGDQIMLQVVVDI
ncbi:MAG: archease [Nanoarchaeota archaeon]|nr:archease [Nanoarchaeota archaeon]